MITIDIATFIIMIPLLVLALYEGGILPLK